MMMKSAVVALMGFAIAAEAGTLNAHYRSPILESRQNRGGNNNNNNNANAGNNNAAAAATCLAANAVQTGSASTGQVNGVAADGQVNSATDKANFINFCSGQTLTNGLQNTGGSCNGIPMGKIPAKTAMVSTVILNPGNGDTLTASQTFNVQLKVANLQAGSFTNATSTYYSAPQDLQNGKIVGHTHVTIQDTGKTNNPTTPLDATTFAFFKGINDAGDGNGGLTAVVTGGLPAGNYRVCTMSSAANHQPVLMPVAQRGAQDDCKYFTVGAGGGGNNGNANNAAAGNNAATGNNGNANAATGNTGNKGAATGNAGANKGNTSGAQSSGTGNSASTATQATAAGKTGATKATSAATKATSAAASTGSKASSGGAIGGVAAPAVADSGDSTRPFSVNGNTFVNKSAAVQRACAIQNNGCADAVNSGKVPGSTVADCNAQETACNAAGGA